MNDSHLRGLIISYFRTPNETPNTEIGKRYATQEHKFKMVSLTEDFELLRELQDDLFNSHNEICDPSEIYTDKDNEYPMKDVLDYIKDDYDELYDDFLRGFNPN
tara:strand:+ start:101 stop:412 length:312 start_codon:yes stop_codon:yes gene_type:complete